MWRGIKIKGNVHICKDIVFDTLVWETKKPY